jgi:type VI secretion system protein VasJ
MAINLKDLQEIGACPVRPGAPAGLPGRDEPEFETLQAELRKLELPDGLQPDWSVVVNSTSAFLRDKSKDLLPACYLCMGLFQLEGYAGMRTGLIVLKDLVEGYWETLFPELKRMRGRAAAFDWLADRASKAVAGRPPGPGEREMLAGCLETMQQLGDLLRDKMDTGEALGALYQALREAQERAEIEDGPVTAPPAQGAPPASGAAASEAAAAPALPVEVKTADEAAKVLASIKEMGFRLAQYLQASEQGNPLGYRLPRMLAWMHLREIPPSTDGQTSIPAPQPADLAAKIEELAGRGAWPGVLENTESRFPAAILWLDLQRHAVFALENQGDQVSAQAICDELDLLLRRLPGLEGLKFQNGQPLANNETRAWIERRVRKTAGAPAEASASSSAPASSGGEANPLFEADREACSKARDEARSLWRSKRLPEGLRLLEAAAAQARTFRGRLLCRFETASLIKDAGLTDTAQAQFQLLDDELQSAGSEDWDPVFCLEVVKNLFQCHQKAVSLQHSHTGEELARSRELLARLCRLDVSAAISFEGKR